MSFTITPDLAYMFNTFSMIEVNGISYLWGALFAILITLIISTEAYHIKITALPTVLMLHTIGIYQHILIILIAGAMFVTTALSFKLLTGGVQAVKTFANTVDSGLTKSIGAVKYGGFKNAKLMRKLKPELENAKLTTFKDKWTIPELNRLSKDEKAMYLDRDERFITDKLNVLTNTDKINQRKNEDFYKKQLEILGIKGQQLNQVQDIQQKSGYQHHLKKEFAKKQSKLIKEGLSSAEELFNKKVDFADLMHGRISGAFEKSDRLVEKKHNLSDQDMDRLTNVWRNIQAREESIIDKKKRARFPY